MEEETRNFDKEFEKIYQEVCSNCEAKLKEDRKKLNKFLLTVFLVAIIINIIIYFFAEVKGIVTGTIAVTFCVMLFLIIQGREIYKKNYKRNVITALTKAYNPKLYYDSKTGISKYDYTMSNFDTSFNEFFSEDQIYGTLENGIKIRTAEVATAIVNRTKQPDGTIKEDRTETYRGMYGIIKMPHNITSRIYIANDSITKRYSENRIELDSAEFEKYYDCMSDEKVRALRVLTSEVIEKFNDIRRNSKFGFELKVEDDMIYFRYKCGQLFEPPTFGNGLDKELLKKYYRYIYFPLELVIKLSENISHVVMEE